MNEERNDARIGHNVCPQVGSHTASANLPSLSLKSSTQYLFDPRNEDYRGPTNYEKEV